MKFTPKLLAKTPSIVIEYPVPLASLYTGIAGEVIHYNRSSICPVCHGTRVDAPSHQQVRFALLFHEADVLRL